MCCAVVQTQTEQHIVAKMQEMQSGFHSQMRALEQSMEPSKYELIQAHFEEMDSLCRILRDRFQGDGHGGAPGINGPAMLSVLEGEVCCTLCALIHSLSVHLFADGAIIS